MSLDDATQRLALSLQGKIRERTRERADGAARGEKLVYDPASRGATLEASNGTVLRRLYGERLATWTRRDRILRWGWVGAPSSATPSHVEALFHEGEARGVSQLAMSVVADLDREDASTLARLGALVASAYDVHEIETERDVEFVGLFDTLAPVSVAARYSVPPPPVEPATRPIQFSTPPPAHMSVPTVVLPRDQPLREPGRASFGPVATATRDVLQALCPGFQQALLVLSLTSVGDKRNLSVQLVVLDAQGLLGTIDVPRSILHAAAAMIESDDAAGNGAWRKLTARITPKIDGGATLNVVVLPSKKAL